MRALLIALAVVSASSKDYNIGDFKKNYFKIITATKGFYEVKAGFENVANEIIINSGFVNEDLYADIITVTQDRKAGHFYIYDDSSNKFKLNMITPSLPDGEKILNIKLTQIKSQNSYPDVVVISQKSSSNTLTTVFRGYSIDKVGGDYEYSLTLIPEYYAENVNNTTDESQEPFNIQIFEDRGLVDYWLLMKDKERVLYYYNNATSKFERKAFSDILDQGCPGCKDLSEISGKAIPVAYTSAFIDINRDCRADIVLETHDDKGSRYLEFYYYMNSKFGLINVVQIPSTYSLGVVEDINENNNPDLLFIDKNSGKLVVYLNNYSVNEKNSDDYCSKTVSTEFMYPSLEDSSNTTYMLTQELVKNSTLYENPDQGIQGFIRLGDLDLDSYKDLTLNLTVNGKTDVFVFLNRPCSDAYISDTGSSSSLCRYFNIDAVADEDTSVMRGKNAVQSIYFDLGERG